MNCDKYDLNHLLETKIFGLFVATIQAGIMERITMRATMNTNYFRYDPVLFYYISQFHYNRTYQPQSNEANDNHFNAGSKSDHSMCMPPVN